MKTGRHLLRAAGPATGAAPKSRDSEGGFAVLLVLILLVIMVSLAVGNNVALGNLQAELRLVEKRQQLQRESIRATNAPAAPTTEVIAPSPKPSPTR